MSIKCYSCGCKPDFIWDGKTWCTRCYKIFQDGVTCIDDLNEKFKPKWSIYYGGVKNE